MDFFIPVELFCSYIPFFFFFCSGYWSIGTSSEIDEYGYEFDPETAIEMLQEEGFDLSSIETDFAKLSEEGKTVLLFARRGTISASTDRTDGHCNTGDGSAAGSAQNTADGSACADICENSTPADFRILGMIAVADVEKPSSLEAIRQFEKLGIDVVMLTGDNEKTAAAIGKRLHIKHVIAQVLPHQKEEKVRELMEQGHKVAMIGDGINDAPALARADVGIAIGAGTDVAIESADAVLIRNDLMDAVNAIRLSKSVIRNIRENLFWAFFYNSIGIPLAAGLLYPAFGLKLNPMFGAAAMSLSSVCVVCNALRLRLFKPLHSEHTAEAATPQTNSLKGEQTMKELTLTIEGMMCMHCQKHATDALNAIEGVSAEVNLEEKKAYVKTDREIDDAVFKKAIADAGYEVTDIVRA